MRKLILLLVSALWTHSLAFADQGAWLPTGSLAGIRADATATLLPSGQVLVAGGSGADGEVYDTAELYDPAAGTWTPTARMNSARTRHTATLLPTGQVLVVGGLNGSALDTAELFGLDPATGTWRWTLVHFNLGHARSQHTATLLNSGKVLVAGGFDASGAALASTELYEPSTQSWTAAPPLNSPRGQHTATLLPSGQVLLTGGRNGQGLVAETEVFIGTEWLSTGPLKQARICHTATLLPSGKVLVVGGASDSQCGADGSPFTAASAVEVFTPAAQGSKWRLSPKMNASRALHTAVLLPSGKLLVAGGASPSGASDLNPGSEVYDCLTGWQADANLPDSGGNLRRRHAAVLLPSGDVLLAGGDRLRSAALYEPPPAITPRTQKIAAGGMATAPTTTLLPSGKVLIAGGSLHGAATSQAWLYDPAAGTWTSTGAFKQPRVGHTATLLPNGKVLVTGGRTGLDLSGSTPLKGAEIYDPAIGTWSGEKKLNTARSGHTATLLPSGKVLVAGGMGSTAALDGAEIYDPGSGQWSPTGSPMTGARSEHAAVLLNSGKVLVAGGFAGTALGSAELYDPGSDSWSPTGPLLIPRRRATATLLPTDQVLLAGGAGFDPLAETEIYDPQTEQWALGVKLRHPRSEHAALLLPSGKVLFAGGWDGSRTPLSAVEIYDPAAGSLATGGAQEVRRAPATALLPSGKILLAGGTDGSGADLATAEILDLDSGLDGDGPVIISACSQIDFGQTCEITGRFSSAFEASGGGTNNSAVNHPLVQLLSLEGGQESWLLPQPKRPNAWHDPMTLVVTSLPSGLNPGWHRLTVFTSGRAGASRLIQVGCGLAIVRPPASQTVALGETATFTVEAQGGRTYQWQRNGADIPGATSPAYTTPPAVPADAGTQYQVEVRGGCESTVAGPAELRVQDDVDPVASVLIPVGGEYWPLSSPQQIKWSMSDLVGICKVEVSLEYSSDGGDTYRTAPILTLSDASCTVTQTSLPYTVPDTPPGGPGSLYRIQLQVTNHNRSAVAYSQPFFIVQPNPGVHTLILANVARMQAKMSISQDQATTLSTQLGNLAKDPNVLGLVLDLNAEPTIKDLYTEWDGEPESPDRANRLLFGCHQPDCAPERDGIHDKIRELAQIYSGLKYLVLVGDDRIIPFARIPDRTALLPEASYVDGNLPTVTTVSQALTQNQILSDNPLASLGPVQPADLAAVDDLMDSIFVPDLATGRLVERPEEIITTISTFISKGGRLDLAALKDKVLVTGYDFLLDSGKQIRDRWKSVLNVSPDDSSLAPVDDALLTPSWGADNPIDRALALQTHLCGNGDGQSYPISFLNGHGTHDQEGVPGNYTFDIQGLSASDIGSPNFCGNQPLSLAGGVISSIGCHGGLPVPGSTPGNRSLDLPQTFLSRGAVAYVANTGYGWGLLYGIGYSERLQQILAEEMTQGGIVLTGDALKNTKLRYLHESPRLDPYDEKSLLQWTFFGLPMYAVNTGIAPSGTSAADLSAAFSARPAPKAAPDSVSIEPFSLDFTGRNVYEKRRASGDLVLAGTTGCPEINGCYYTLNGLATGMSDQTIQPYTVSTHSLANTSLHGVLWTGGTFQEEAGWKPVIAELISNGQLGSDHGSLPPHDLPKPRRRRQFNGADPTGCQSTDTVPNSIVIAMGEVLGPDSSIQRIFTQMDFEDFYFNDLRDPTNNCDVSGPVFTSQSPYHQIDGTKVTWNLRVDDESKVWRVVVVYNTETAPQWIPLELKNVNGSTWQGELDLGSLGAKRLAYVIQAVDFRGNVSWLDFEPATLPESGVNPDVPLVVEVNTN